jgi:hypothetical protein
VQPFGLSELYFSIIQRKVLTPNDFLALVEVAHRLLAFADHYNRTAQPFAWKFTRQDLDRRLAQLEERRATNHDLAQAA